MLQNLFIFNEGKMLNSWQNKKVICIHDYNSSHVTIALITTSDMYFNRIMRILHCF